MPKTTRNEIPKRGGLFGAEGFQVADDYLQKVSGRPAESVDLLGFGETQEVFASNKQ